MFQSLFMDSHTLHELVLPALQHITALAYLSPSNTIELTDLQRLVHTQFLEVMRLRFGKTLVPPPQPLASPPQPARIPLLIPKRPRPPPSHSPHITRRVRGLTRVDLVELKHYGRRGQVPQLVHQPQTLHPSQPSPKLTPIDKYSGGDFKQVEATPDMARNVIMIEEDEVSICDGIINFSEEGMERVMVNEGSDSGRMEEESEIDFEFASELERPIPFGSAYSDLEAEPT